jgi:hypothetical protein
LPPLKVPDSPGGVSGGFVRIGLAYPWLWLCSVYAVWLAAWATLDRQPRALLDDPKNIAGWVDAVHTASIILFMLALPIWAASVIAVFWRGFLKRAEWKNVLLWLVVLQLSWTLAVVVVRVDPGHVVAWYLD